MAQAVEEVLEATIELLNARGVGRTSNDRVREMIQFSPLPTRRWLFDVMHSGEDKGSRSMIATFSHSATYGESVENITKALWGGVVEVTPDENGSYTERRKAVIRLPYGDILCTMTKFTVDIARPVGERMESQFTMLFRVEEVSMRDPDLRDTMKTVGLVHCNELMVLLDGNMKSATFGCRTCGATVIVRCEEEGSGCSKKTKQES